VGLLERTGELSGSWFSSLTDATPARDAQLYLMEPYDPRKTPLLMVHGLIATPIGWASVTNDLWGDPAIRRRYQVWHYHYPTSAPFLYSAYVMRQRLDEVRALLRDEGYGEIRPMVVIAHSMGGLLTKTLITDSGEDAWKVILTRPVGTLAGAPEDVALVNDILHWRARTHVRRVIFVAVPHRGSGTSLTLVGRLGARLAGVPAAFTGVYARLDRENPGALTPGFRAALRRGLTSIDTLSPRHPILPLLDAKPFAPWVTVHSIIGDRGKPGPLADGSDGVVPYSSSHLDAAASELVVPAGHRAYANPAAVSEVKRILALP
jgi:pimeloyl-ACP methyl ester carboxylesterase